MMDATWPRHNVSHADVVRLGLWMFLGTVTMLFAAFASAYIVRRSGTDWQHVALPNGLLLVNTTLLASSSVALESAVRRGGASRWRASSLALVSAIVLGCAFLAGQLLAWRQLMAAGTYLPSGPHGAFFYVLSGAHGIHVIAALCLLSWGAWLTLTGVGRSDPARWDLAIGLCRTFWHFLLVVWLFVWLFVSVY
jgi:cytochrome c oxidase subunit 3